MELAFIKCHGSGNDFALVDARDPALAGQDWVPVARRICDRAGPVGADGILLLVQGDKTHAFGMRVINADGSEPETCLNGLRCIGRAGLEALGLESASVKLKTSSAGVERQPELAPGVVTVRTIAGPASSDPGDVGLRVPAPVIDAAVPGLPSSRAFTALAMPNPHLITFVDRIDVDELVALGSWCEARPGLLADRANVSFVEMRDDGLFVQTFERGVGLTNACGTAMGGATHAAGLTGRVPFGQAITVHNPGGKVRVTAEGPDGSDRVIIDGNATFIYEATIEIGDELGPLKITRDRAAEEAAWRLATR
ncbi:diaminopimelate epimerase [Sphingomonas turrisvirgatae]|uniref:Diaminopimelate epimerase n=1 Tax=Sphingomonas turrisvirgatae TaxID=1888892 RepID=A0A1E3M113_9SPHN|nr:diaminopimelate epimerase [Sphingomonas turrisvirgatae]ODP39679.1 diaminopimelate epimerase [Sphingomonas turrisvirgatae]